jgi:hypothetical protein
MTEVPVAKHLLMAVLILVVAGCYREPTHPSQRSQNAAPTAGTSDRVMPKDDIHAGLTPEPGPVIESRVVEVGPLVLTAPNEWVRRQPSSQFLLTEFSLPKADGDVEDGRLTVSTAMGSLDDNLNRWKGQFGGKPDKESQETLDIGGVNVTWVDYSGTYNSGMFAPATPKPGYRMLAAVIPLGTEMCFVKGLGPEKTVAAHAEQIRSFIMSLQSKQGTEAKPADETKPNADVKPAAETKSEADTQPATETKPAAEEKPSGGTP